MARIRSVKPEFFSSEKIGMRLPGPEGRQARLLFVAMWGHAEDLTGVCRAAPAFLRAQAFPYDDDLTAADVDRWLAMLESGGFILRYEVNGSHYALVRGFLEHQKIDRPSKPTLPLPTEDSLHPRRVVDEDSSLEGKGREGSGREIDPPPPPTGGAEQRPLLEVDPDSANDTPAPDVLQALWNRVAVPEGRPRWQSMNGRERPARSALKACADLERWEAYLRWRLKDPFYRGESDRGWTGADVEWFLRAKTAREVCDFDPATARAPPAARGRMDTRPSDFSKLPEGGEDLGTFETEL